MTSNAEGPARALLDDIARDLARRFEGIYSTETVARYVHDSYAALAATARTAAFSPLLTERFTREQLTALAQAEGVVVTSVPEVLYVCTHNAGRSVAAAVLTEHYARGRVHVRSAGSQPGSEINPAVAEVLRERGLDPDRQFPKPLTDEAARARRRDRHHGLRRRVPGVSRQALPRLGAHRSRRQARRGGAAHRRRIDERVRALLAELLGEAVA